MITKAAWHCPVLKWHNIKKIDFQKTRDVLPWLPTKEFLIKTKVCSHYAANKGFTPSFNKITRRETDTLTASYQMSDYIQTEYDAAALFLSSFFKKLYVVKDLPGPWRSRGTPQHLSNSHTRTGTWRICKECPDTPGGTARESERR